MYIEVEEKEDFNLNMEELTHETPADAEEFNERFKQVLENEKLLIAKNKDVIEALKNIGSNMESLRNSINAAGDELNRLKTTEVTGTLVAGQTSITLTNDAITTNSTIEPYTTVYGVNPKTMIIVNSSVIMTFKAQSQDVGVKVVVR